mmetsp:Transcript_1391/g.1794  ORF Transcript_1391/g.1794 Transcript_1391/m.1794 type:complete len:361 (-) Transcript_1391:62-1144(-)
MVYVSPGRKLQLKICNAARKYWRAMVVSMLVIHIITRSPGIHKKYETQQLKPSLQIKDVRGEEDEFKMARNQSFGFFDDITNAQWARLRYIAAKHVNHLFPDFPFTHNPHFEQRHRKYFKSYPAWWQTNYEPNFSCQFEVRVGGNGNGDGPKWVCDPHRIVRMAKARKAKDPTHPGCVIYSIGSNGDFSFEYGMMEILGNNTCEFHIFDMGDYESRMPEGLGRATYHQWGLKKQDPNALDTPAPGQRLYGLKDTIKLLGHENLDTIDIFKIDCDNCEWKTFKDWLDPDIPMLQQIQVELHGARPAAIDFFDGMEEEGYVRFHKEPNIQFNDGSCIEYALLKLDKNFFGNKNETLKLNLRR